MRSRLMLLCPIGLSFWLGCGVDARLDLQASRTLDALAAELDTALAEYHADIAELDQRRLSTITDALVDRLLSGDDAPDKVAGDVDDFKQALAVVLHDRDIAHCRYQTASGNVRSLREVSAGLRGLAIESMTLDDEARRYLRSWVDLMQQPDPTTQPSTE